ncbi:conserved membrane protein of unknown function [Rhodovastum atsumiense]|uniref:Uncharacterized protein n=1 Tax=Rhodovastum atsumiense TaxID=504468 RepID=A0A5M6IXN2_9PROT|nr:hypothetical protein [Rhodovastum atsumiense]KAA5613093.1 hypothetical protein F1189_06975 [Rhodovastum atsumiense]CAH2600036.1 conserved membrane protein of unknown function [Rhodovastum atsumiense]
MTASLPQRRSVMRGILQLALLRAGGMEQFGDSRQCFLNSLAPLVAFPLVGGVLGMVSGAGVDALAGLLGTLVALLTPPVLSHLLARLWRREAEWLRYATAFNWSRWAMLLALSTSLLLIGLFGTMGLTQRGAVGLGLLAVAIYGFVLDAFVARVGLRLSWGRAVLLVLAVNLGAALLFLGPRVIAGLQALPPA